MIAGIAILATLTVVTAASVMRSQNSSRATKVLRNVTERQQETRTMLNLAIQRTKDYANTPGQTLTDLLSGASKENRFVSWFSDSYKGNQYSLSVADNTELGEGTQNYAVDTDNTAYVDILIAFADGDKEKYRIGMSPGSAASEGTPGTPPADLPGGVGVCYGWLNFMTLLSTGSTDVISGHNSTPGGMYSCAGPADCTDASLDQFGIATTSYFGTWELGTVFNWNSNSGQIIGLPSDSYNPWTGNPGNLSIAKAQAEDCDSYDDIQTLADNMLSDGNSALSLYQKNWGTMSVGGSRTFGSEANPEVVYVKTGIFGKVRFTGPVEGHGILIADGNVTFEDTVDWYGVVVNDANALGNILTFQDPTTIYGAVMLNRPILTAEIGSASLDLRFAGTNNTITYSADIVDSILQQMDPNYVSPIAPEDGTSFSLQSVQKVPI